jgi:DNA-binding CsgD family transcriptional regulator
MKKWTLKMNEQEISKEKYLKVALQYNFTKRELELGFLKISGFSNRRIAYMFGISEQTVKNHFTKIYEKAWVPGRKEFKELFLKDEL